MRKILSYLAIASSVLTGLIFIFSGFVKAVDPLGSTYKFTDYFTAFNMPWLEPAAFPLAIALSGIEFLIGICLLFFIKNRLANTGALLFMIIFTPLTLWLALTDPVKDCGCFGDAIILSNWETFFKNIIISGLVIISFINRNNLPYRISPASEWAIVAITAVMITAFSWYNYQHLPVIDFRPYKIGANIPEGMIIPEGAPANVYEQYYTLRDTLTGNEVRIESNAYVLDSTYWKKGSVWKFISSSEAVLVKKGFEPPIHDFSITSLDGEEITQAVLSDTGYYFILVAYDLKKSDAKRQSEINFLYTQVISDNNKFICLTASGSDEIEKFRKLYDIPYNFFVTDPITLKTIIRSNPGLVILKNGTVAAKWHHNDIPDYESIKTNISEIAWR